MGQTCGGYVVFTAGFTTGQAQLYSAKWDGSGVVTHSPDTLGDVAPSNIQVDVVNPFSTEPRIYFTARVGADAGSATTDLYWAVVGTAGFNVLSTGISAGGSI